MEYPKALLAVTLFLSQPAIAAVQTPSLTEKSYWDTVQQYAHNQRAEAVNSIGAWTDKDLEPVLRAVEKIVHDAERCRACEARDRLEGLPLRAAILLHAERERTDRLANAESHNGTPDCTVGVHGAASERLSKAVSLQKDGPAFVARFSVGMVVHYRAVFCFGHAVHRAEAGLKISPNDPELLLALGLSHESLGTITHVQLPLLAYFDSRTRSLVMPQAIDRKTRLNQAREAFEKALVEDPSLHEARLRLGVVQRRLGRLDEARRTLVKTAAESEGAILYLAHLFLGQVLEDTHDISGAAAEYTAALKLQPTTQVAAVALAHALTLSGDGDRAREVLEGALRFANRRQGNDPYSSYLIGTVPGAEVLLDQLRLGSGK